MLDPHGNPQGRSEESHALSKKGEKSIRKKEKRARHTKDRTDLYSTKNRGKKKGGRGNQERKRKATTTETRLNPEVREEGREEGEEPEWEE